MAYVQRKQVEAVCSQIDPTGQFESKVQETTLGAGVMSGMVVV